MSVALKLKYKIITNNRNTKIINIRFVNLNPKTVDLSQASSACVYVFSVSVCEHVLCYI